MRGEGRKTWGWGRERVHEVRSVRMRTGKSHSLYLFLNRITETAEAMVVLSKYDQMVSLIKE